MERQLATFTSDVTVWHHADEAVTHARRALQVARDQERLARFRAADRRHHLQAARAARHEAFALGLLHAAEAHEALALRAAASCAALEAHLHVLEALAARAADRVRRRATGHAPAPGGADVVAGCSCGEAA